MYCSARSHISTLPETVGARVSTLEFVRGERHILILLVEQPSERARNQQSVASSDICPSELQVAMRAFESLRNATVQLSYERRHVSACLKSFTTCYVSLFVLLAAVLEPKTERMT